GLLLARVPVKGCIGCAQAGFRTYSLLQSVREAQQERVQLLVGECPRRDSGVASGAVDQESDSRDDDAVVLLGEEVVRDVDNSLVRSVETIVVVPLEACQVATVDVVVLERVHDGLTSPDRLGDEVTINVLQQVRIAEGRED